MTFHTDLEGSSFYSLGGGGNYKTKTLINFPLLCVLVFIGAELCL